MLQTVATQTNTMLQTVAAQTEAYKVSTSHLPVPHGTAHYVFEHMTSHNLRSLGSLDGVHSLSSQSRTSLLTLADTAARANHSLTWEVHDGKVPQQQI